MDIRNLVFDIGYWRVEVPLKFEDLRVLEAAEAVADNIWQQVTGWDPFAREIVGGQLARAADSVGANIAEAFGRYHYGEKLQFLYYARGSLFETKYWLNRARTRDLVPSAQAKDYGSQLSDLARQLNAFAAALKAQRRGSRQQSQKVREATNEYVADEPVEIRSSIFTEEDFGWLEAVSNT
jgi:four helix bundle protein